MLADLFHELNEGFVQPYLHRLKAKALLMAVSIALMSLFGVLAFVFAIVMVFVAISNASSPMEAAVVMFGFCVVMCLGTLIMFKLASHMEARKFDAGFAVPERPRQMLKSLRMDERIDDIKDQFRETVARNKFGGLAAVALAGMLIGSRPRWALGLARFALGRKLKQRVRERTRR